MNEGLKIGDRIVRAKAEGRSSVGLYKAAIIGEVKRSWIIQIDGGNEHILPKRTGRWNDEGPNPRIIKI